MDILLISIGVLLSIAGLIGCIVPGLPGPPLNFIALVFLRIISSAMPGGDVLIWSGVFTISITVLDYILPAFGAKYFGISSFGTWGSFLGMIIGIFFFPPAGMIIGIILGAVLGELIAGKGNIAAIKAGGVTFLLSLLMIVFKLVLSFIMTYYFVKSVISYL